MTWKRNETAMPSEAGTILIVEDDEDISSLLGRGFSLEGYGVDFARTGPEALARAKQTAYHAIILDVMLPGASGMEVARELRESGRDAPIIMLSARDSVADRVQGLSAGADDYVVKPFAFEELLARVRAHGRRQTPAAGGADARCGRAGRARQDPGRWLRARPEEAHPRARRPDDRADRSRSRNHGAFNAPR